MGNKQSMSMGHKRRKYGRTTSNNTKCSKVMVELDDDNMYMYMYSAYHKDSTKGKMSVFQP